MNFTPLLVFSPTTEQRSCTKYQMHTGMKKSGSTKIMSRKKNNTSSI
jgi:hypothetical protein